ncbi:Adenylate cyclase [Nitrincola lacisaponensis]|uniref:Adenylate cyclase n=1 Tax=Nitrincola lacisaponensis TaxID=267850 RepID=A0A063Y2C1_9GAMM|nr:CYTH and CHAD domain-containing protein [Nitrincola lacisaponensis]KDE38901.1 Adenylate cyclase [Nitrincola lacisaponensis]
MGKETELKLSLPSACVPALRAHPLLQAAETVGAPKTLDNTYFDTADLQLQQRQIALRTRQQGDVWLQTVKCSSVSVGGLSQRPEWEKPYTGEFDFSDIELKPLRKLLSQLQSQLQPVFTTLFTRQTLFMKRESGAEILLMLDQGDILAGGHQQPLCELELELVSGAPEDLLQLAVELSATLPLLPSDVSKAERGYRLYRSEPEVPVTMPSVLLHKRQNPVEAFKALAFACVAQWQGNVTGASVSHDPEFVHQLRISQRRLRSLLRLFAPVLPESWCAHWNSVLADNARLFSDLRDLDVMSDEVLPGVLILPGADDWPLQSLHQLVCAQRDQARMALMDHPDLQRQGQLILTLVLELHALAASSDQDLSLSRFIDQELKPLRKRVRKRYRQALKTRDEAALHALRIALKPLRYALEFFMGVLPGQKTLTLYEAVLVAVRALGQVNDLHVSRRVLAGLTAADAGHQAALAFMSGLQSATLIEQRKIALRALKKVM